MYRLHKNFERLNDSTGSTTPVSGAIGAAQAN
jgi:hypothetical protein